MEVKGVVREKKTGKEYCFRFHAIVYNKYAINPNTPKNLHEAVIQEAIQVYARGDADKWRTDWQLVEFEEVK